MFGYLSPSVRRDLFFTLFPRHASVLRSVCQSAPVSTNLIVPDSRSLHQKNSSCFSFIGGRFLSRHKERSPKPDGFGLLVEKFTLRRVIEISALGELRSATGGLETVLKFFDCRFSLIFRAFLPFRFLVVLFLNHKNRCFFNQKPSDVAHHLPHQKAPLAYCTSPLHRCP